jgi:predicted DNA-binding transcriptional regulator YafY
MQNMRASRLMSILILLQLRTRVTAESLANEFEVSVRTIYRDIDELSAAGIPVQSDRGPNGGFQLMAGYQTKLTGLESNEAEAVFMIGMPGAAAELGMGSAATSASRKLLASLPPALSADASRIGARFHLDPADWYQTSEPLPHLPALARAMLDQKVVNVEYQSWKGVSKQQLAPLGLVLKAGAWYLVASASSGKRPPRIYKVAAILQQQVDDAGFDRPANFNLVEYWRSQLIRFEAELRPSTATVRASEQGLQRLAALGSFAQAAVKMATPPDRYGWSTLQLPIESTDHAARMLLGMGDSVEVSSPPALREAIRVLAQAVFKRHTKAPSKTRESKTR